MPTASSQLRPAAYPRRRGRQVLHRVLLAAVLTALGGISGQVCAGPGYAAIVVDADSGVVLHQVNATRRWYPASLTKMMTLLLTFKALAAHRLRLQDRLSVSRHAAAQPESRLGLRSGERISVRKAILAVITRSANDAAVTLAERLAGSERAFAAQMTAEARHLGMSRTVFRNATGLPDKAQTTTARDMAILARALVRRFPGYYHFFGIHGFTWKRRYLPTINPMLASYQGADGLKTGFTCASGYNLATSAERGGRRLIGVVLGGRTSAQRNATMVRILNAAFRDPAQDQGGVVLAKLTPPPGTADTPPPFRLPASECPPGGPRLDGVVRGRLPGWGVILGIFEHRKQAHAIAGQARRNLGKITPSARAVVVKRKAGGARRWKALLVGLREGEASDACRRLRNRGTECVVLPPKLLNDPPPMWR